MYLLDTDVLSELLKTTHGRGDANVARWLGNSSADDCFISPITLMEVEIGVLMMERRDANQGLVLRRWMTSRIIPHFQHRILVIDAAVASCCAKLHAKASRSERDAWIAATALAHRMTVVTRNVADFQATGVLLLNPWEPQS